MKLLLFVAAILAVSFGSIADNQTPKEKIAKRPRGHIFFRGRPVYGGFLGHATEDYRHGEETLGDALPTAGPLPGNPHVTINWFNQTLDHLEGSNTRTWMQKYWVNDQFYRPGGPVFIQIGGEGPTSRHWIDINEGVPDYLKNAATYGAMAVQLEHRYYGDSWPVADTTTPNLKWLSSRQALADIAAFIQAFPAIRNLPANTKFITFGGSYSGALSAWFRLKYPHLAVGAIATSGPVLAKVEFQEYFGVVEASLNSYSPDCAAGVKSAFDTMTTLFKTTDGQNQLKLILGLCNPADFTNADNVANFWENMAGNFAGVVQYSQDNRGMYADQITIPKVCRLMMDTTKTPLQRFASVNAMMMSAYGQNCIDISYANMIAYYRNTSFSNSNLAGFLGHTPLLYSRWRLLRWILQQCADIFGPQVTTAVINNAIAQTNLYYGGRNLKATNVVLPNGSVDPWHALGILNSPGPTCPAVYIMGTAHCANMYPPRAQDPPQLTYARNVITANIGMWLNQ